MVGFGNAAGNGRQGIAVSAQGNCQSDGVFKIIAFKKGGNCLRYGFLTAFIEMIMRADLVATLAQIVAELSRNVFFDLRFAHAGACPKDGGGYGLRAFNAFRVVVRYDGGLFGKMQGFFQ